MGSPVTPSKRITPSELHEPSAPVGASQTFCGGPPEVSTFFSLPSAKKARKRESGDQKGRVVPSVPSSACAVRELSGRSQMRVFPAASVALNAMRRPSGDTRGMSIETRSSGDMMSKRAIKGGTGARRIQPYVARPAASEGDGRDGPGELLPVLAARDDGRRQARLRAALRDPLQLQLRVVRRLEPVLRILRQARLHHPVQRRRDHRRRFRDRRRLVPQDRADQRRLALARERLLPRRHLVQHRAEGEDVRARVRLPALELLGRHVLERAEDGPALGQRLR